MAIRAFDVDVVSLTANTEGSWTIPDGCKYAEINKRTDANTTKENAELRIAFVGGETATGNTRKYRSTYSDWWLPEVAIRLIVDRKIYFRCTTGLIVEIVYGVE